VLQQIRRNSHHIPTAIAGTQQERDQLDIAERRRPQGVETLARAVGDGYDGVRSSVVHVPTEDRGSEA
jgi:hypothetical protein